VIACGGLYGTGAYNVACRTGESRIRGSVKAGVEDFEFDPLITAYHKVRVVEGLPLTAYCEAKKLSIPERLVLFRQICDALSYAHRQLVIPMPAILPFVHTGSLSGHLSSRRGNSTHHRT
jgi:serine/threonine protein kinase